MTHATEAADVRRIAASVARAGGSAVAALIFFGSRKTRARTDEHSAYDFFLLTHDCSSLYRSLVASGSVHRPAWLLAGLNAVLPPNVISIRPPHGLGETWRAKCAVATVDCFLRETSAARHDHFFLGRMFQPVEIVYPKEGVIGWMDNVAVPTGAPDLENAKKFLNFLMYPENIALQQKSTGYQSAIAGSNKFLPPELGDSPEFNPPADLKITFAPSCGEKATRAYDKIWTALRQ